MDQYSMYLLYGAVMLISLAWKEFRKPQKERSMRKAALFFLVGAGYLVYTWLTRGAAAMAAAAYNTVYLGVGAALILLGLIRLRARPPLGNRALGLIYFLCGLALIAFGLGLI